LNIIFIIFSFLFGLAIGSFLNVLIYRIPEGISIVKPNSFCPHCRKSITWYENIPVVSYILLKGKCSGCQQSISIHYPIVELITGCLFLYLFIQYRLSAEFFFYIYFFCSLIVVSGIDFVKQEIPPIITIPGIVIGLVFQILRGNFILGFIGLIFGGGLILLIRVVGNWAYKKEVMGMGDVYLTSMIGVFTGFPIILAAIFIAALTGAILGILYIISTHQDREIPIPFGPFLSAGGIFVIILHAPIIKFFVLLGIHL
jgi:leader peptidase (prepilin peptidase)/N-methyltransferase